MNRILSWPFEFYVDSAQVRVYDIQTGITNYLGVVFVDGSGRPQMQYSNTNSPCYLPVKDCLRILGYDEKELGV